MNQTAAGKQIRVFFALWPDAAGRNALAAWQPELQHLCGGRAMHGAGLHTTLVFLGDIEAGRLEALQLAAQEAGGERFELQFKLARYWGHNHIVFAAPAEAPPALLQLVHNLEQRLRKHHFSFEPRSYKPHVTLLRHTQWSDTPLPAMPAVRWRMQEFALVQSHLDEQGARYEVLARFPLGTPGR